MALHIKTDKQDYNDPDIVIVTATLDDWYPGAKIRLVIWQTDTGKAMINKYFDKPSTGDTVTWEVPAKTFYNEPITAAIPYNAQIEFGNLHQEAKFTYCI